VVLHHVIGLAFLVAAFLVSVLAYRHDTRSYAQGKRNRIAGSASFRYVYRSLQVSTLVVGVGSFESSSPVWLKMYDSPALVYAGVILGAIGLSVFVWAKQTLAAAYSPCFESYVPPGLVRSGIYAHVRHPIYSANLLLLLGLALASGSSWLFLNLLVLGAYYVPAALREEKVLSSSFPEYRLYLQESWRFLPLVA
jgi:protein-S-isoprenylcysteine O-methyltransferase Ste14